MRVRVSRALSIADFELRAQRSDLLLEPTIRRLEARDLVARRDQLLISALRFAAHLLRLTDRALTGPLRLDGRGGCLAHLPLRSRQVAVQALSFRAGTLGGLAHLGPGLLEGGLRGFARAVRLRKACLEIGVLPARLGQLIAQVSHVLGRRIVGIGEVSNLRLGTLARIPRVRQGGRSPVPAHPPGARSPASAAPPRRVVRPCFASRRTAPPAWPGSLPEAG